MLYWLLYPLHEYYSVLRIFSYVSFRAIFASVTALLITLYLIPKFIIFLNQRNIKENIRNDGPKSHLAKQGTPTMGGVIIIFSMSISLLLWGNLLNLYVITIWICTLLFACIGFKDDYQKAITQNLKGMTAKKKIILQVIVASIFAIIVYLFPYYPQINPDLPFQLFIPFFKNPIFFMGINAIFFWIFIVVGSSNAVNITDGLDGLAIGLSIIVLVTLAVFTYITGVYDISNYLLLPFIPGSNELSVLIAALIGSSIGFLWYNSSPAQIFMGDTGSLAIGSSIGMIAVCIKKEVLLALLCGIFIIEIISVILQVSSYKITGKRILLMAPLHHHFELKEIPETKLVIRFWICGVVLALLSIATLKIQ